MPYMSGCGRKRVFLCGDKRRSLRKPGGCGPPRYFAFTDRKDGGRSGQDEVPQRPILSEIRRRNGSAFFRYPEALKILLVLQTHATWNFSLESFICRNLRHRRAKQTRAISESFVPGLIERYGEPDTALLQRLEYELNTIESWAMWSTSL